MANVPTYTGVHRRGQTSYSGAHTWAQMAQLYIVGFLPGKRYELVYKLCCKLHPQNDSYASLSLVCNVSPKLIPAAPGHLREE